MVCYVKGISAKKLASKGDISVFFGDNLPAAKDPVPSCALVCMTMFGNVYVHVQKRAGDQYQCNDRDKDSDYFLCPVAKRIIIIPNYIFSSILIHEDNTIYDVIKFFLNRQIITD